jgi:hypothetical protein
MTTTTTNANNRTIIINDESHTLPLIEIENGDHYRPNFDRSEFINGGYSYCNALQDCRSLLFSDKAFGRLMHIQGYIQGLHHSGSVVLANQYADWFLSTLEGLAATQLLSVTIDGVKRSNVPASKVALGDDGSLHSFTFCRYSLMDHSRYLETLWKIAGLPEWKECSYIAQRCEVHKQLQTLTQCKYTEYDSGFINPHNVTEWHQSAGDLHYQRSYNGGLLFHGVNQLAVRIGHNANPWSTHT